MNASSAAVDTMTASLLPNIAYFTSPPLRGGMLTVKAMLGGKPVCVILDTAAETSVITQNLCNKIRCPRYDSSFVTVQEPLFIGSVKVPPFLAIHPNSPDIFKDCHILLGMNVLSSLPMPMHINYLSRFVTFGHGVANPQATLNGEWVVPEDSTVWFRQGNDGAKARRKVGDFLRVWLSAGPTCGEAKLTPWIIDTGAFGPINYKSKLPSDKAVRHHQITTFQGDVDALSRGWCFKPTPLGPGTMHKVVFPKVTRSVKQNFMGNEWMANAFQTVTLDLSSACSGQQPNVPVWLGGSLISRGQA